jgi:predicted enzyme related to lactoylglutathione lyase
MSTTSTIGTISRISIVTIHVKDQDEAVRFYTECLGFEKRSDAPMGENMRWVTVAPVGSVTEFVLANNFGDGAQVGSATGVVLETDDIDAAYRELSSKGVRFTHQPSREFFGGWAEFADQDGNTFGLHSNQ